ncbi:peroxisomal membrane protein PEX14 isoform X2 [Cryptomeria japonica]|uniref:peroxisomal membrane protein PEX14 isoform X2 n=1 Tax=Cryptomeria japonica TaxID=3369 RepID=UPI0027DA6117|nr:peroxisomal membrane protein PEX14 isoform X2 [Cryptomeria japonica]
MATETSPNQIDGKQLSGESVKVVEGGGAPEDKGDVTKEKDGSWPFANSETVREDQVQNAVKFLSHPKVRGSPVMYRRSFLERKGLTKEEIDEAFRRVPDPTSQELATRTTAPTQERQSMPLATQQSQSPVQTLQHSAGPLVTTSTPPMVQPSRFHWTHLLLALGLLSATGAGTGVVFQKAVIPRFKSWIRQIAAGADDFEQKKAAAPSPAEEAVVAAKAAAAAAAEVAEASREMLKSKLEDSKHLEGMIHSLEEQTKEMKSMKTALQEIENHRHEVHITGSRSDSQSANETNRAKSNGALGAVSSINQLDRGGVSQTISKNFTVDASMSTADQNLVRPSSAPARTEPSQAPYSNSYIEEVNDKPPYPNQLPSNPRLQPRAKPWETIQAQSTNSKHSMHAQNVQTVNSSAVRDGTKAVVNGLGNIQPQPAYPVTVRTSETHEPWWRPKKNETELPLGFSTPSESNARIAEMESNDEEINGGTAHVLPSGSLMNTAANGPSNSSLHDLNDRGWVPPPPPPVAMPQAAKAIWHPKSNTQIQQNLTSEVSVSSGSVLRPESTDNTFMPPEAMTEQEEHVVSSSEVQNITEINHLSRFTEEASYETNLYKDVANEGFEVKEDV